MVQTPAKLITLEEFLANPETKPASEYIDGQIFQKPMPQGQHSRLQQKLTNAVNIATEEAHIALALPELRCTFGGRSTVSDVAVFQWHRLPIHPDGTIANAFNAPPDWVIEILSPEQSSTRVASNILHCLNHGSQLGWLIDPNERLVQIYDADKRVISLETSIDRLPSPVFASKFQITLGELFGWLQVR